MIISALLTSVGINLGLCFLFFTLYSILRKQPGNAGVYSPRLLAEGVFHPRTDFLERLVPSTNWVIRAWRPSEDELLSISGLDAVVFMRIFIFSLRVFSFATIVGVFLLLPINYLGNQLDVDFFDLPNKSLGSFSISNVDDGSNRLWVHFCAMYVFTAFVCYLLYGENNHISLKRIACFYSSKPQPHQFTVLVRSVPKSSAGTISETVERFFMEYYPSTYLSCSVVHQARKIQCLTSDADRLYKRLAHLKQTSQRFGRAGILGLFQRKIDLVEHYGKKVESVQDKLRTQQSLLSGKEISAAFVSFKTRLGASVILHMQQGENPTKWITELAPEPQDVYWPFFSASFMTRWVGNLLVIVGCVVLTVLFFIPVVIVQSLANLDQLETWFPFLKGVLSITFVSQVITGYLPSVILRLFLYAVPPIMIILSSIQGFIASSQIEKSACVKVLWFTTWNIFFANVLSGSAFYRVNVFLEPKQIPNILAAAVPGQASFFISYVVTFGWTSISSELFRLFPLISSFVRRNIFAETVEEFEVPAIPYSSEIPRILLFGLLGITYFILAPLILPFLLVYYCLGYIIYRHQFLNVYSPKSETNGTFWPIIHNSTIFSLVLMHIIAIGIFGLKDLPLASSLTVPLPLITLLFNNYCQKRFLPIFISYPAECLIKKDKSDESDPTMAEFYEQLVDAYQDPALTPILHPDNADCPTSPLLHAAYIQV